MTGADIYAFQYSYDELGRLTNRSINGAANAASVQYDSLGRVQNVTNPLGIFNYAYVNTTGRLDHVDFANGQKTQYAYFDNLGDQRLQEIKNLDPSNAVISQFDYTYNPVGQITSWIQANSGQANSRRYDYGYDAADQLRSANLVDTITGGAVNQYAYDYDPSGNRANTQVGSTITTSTANNLNQITSQSSGGKMHFRGTVDEPATVTVAGNPGTVDAAGNFDGTVNVNVGANTVAVAATDASGNTQTNNYQVTVPSGVNATLLYDLNGNLTNDGSKTYEWDAVNRCVAINLGTHRTEMSYDGQNRESKRVERENGTVTETKQFIWEGWQRSEERDANNQVSKRFCAEGEQIDGSAYFYSRDHLGSIRELSDSAGVVHARYDYDPYGVRTKLSGDLDADFGFTGHYVSNQYSDLAFAALRVYSDNLGRWISRDPIAEAGGVNLYAYGGNNSTNAIDPLGLDAIVLLASKAIGGQGHIAILVGNNSTGWSYYSRNGYDGWPWQGKNGDFTRATFDTFNALKNSGLAEHYDQAYHIQTTPNQDQTMTAYGDEHYNERYHSIIPPSNNCADLTEKILAVGRHPISGDNQYPFTFNGFYVGSPEVPKFLFSNLIKSKMGRLWNVFP